ncbi:MAG: hypothetical protein ACAH12_09670 [Methylophilaceae bacterium]
MSDKTLIAEGLNTIFQQRASSIVIGLTGRTGSGCSTVAKEILSLEKFSEISLKDIEIPMRTHEDRKKKIIKSWLNTHWKPFTIIQVSHVITSFALESFNGFRQIVSDVAKDDLFDSQVLIDQGLDFVQINLSNNFKGILNNIENCEDEEIAQAYDYYFKKLPIYSEKIKEYLNKAKEGIYTKTYQTLGDTIRTSGLNNLSQTQAAQLFALPSRIHQLIKLCSRHNQLIGQNHNYFAIDALRHQFEIRYFKERIPSFYAMAVTTEEETRRNRLLALGLRVKEIDALDAKEYPIKNKTYQDFVSQNIQACLEISDIHISNLSKTNPKDITELSYQVIKYVALMQHPGLVTPGSIERCMQAAVAARMNSGCISRQVGAVVTDENYSIKAIGWNDVPKGQVPCLLRYSRDVIRNNGDVISFSDFELKNEKFKNQLKKEDVVNSELDEIKGRHITYCFKSVYSNLTGEKNQVHTRSLHAEENAFLQVSKYGGQAIEGGNLFTSASPCELCAKKAYQLGIKNIYFIDPYPGISSSHILGVGDNRPTLNLFSGAIGRAFHNLYESIMPYKDEINSLIVTSDRLI